MPSFCIFQKENSKLPTTEFTESKSVKLLSFHVVKTKTVLCNSEIGFPIWLWKTKSVSRNRPILNFILTNIRNNKMTKTYLRAQNSYFGNIDHVSKVQKINLSPR